MGVFPWLTETNYLFHRCSWNHETLRCLNERNMRFSLNEITMFISLHDSQYRTNIVTIKNIIKIDWFLVFNVTFSNISAISWRPVLVVEEGGSTRREPPTMGKQLVNFITCSCESSAPFFVIYKDGLEPTPYWW